MIRAGNARYLGFFNWSAWKVAAALYPHWHWRNVADGPFEAALAGHEIAPEPRLGDWKQIL